MHSEKCYGILTLNLECTVSNHVPSISSKMRTKTLNQCTIQFGGCNATQCWWEGGAVCSKLCPRYCCVGIARSTCRCGISCAMTQDTLTVPTHSPDSDPTHVSSNSTSEGEGITRTGGGSCSELPSNIAWRTILHQNIMSRTQSKLASEKFGICHVPEQVLNPGSYAGMWKRCVPVVFAL